MKDMFIFVLAIIIVLLIIGLVIVFIASIFPVASYFHDLVEEFIRG